MLRPENDSCQQPASSTLLLAVRQFNEGAYFTCHETLEDLWFVETIPLRAFYQGLLQVAVGLNHLRRGNERGAVSLLNSGSKLLRPFAPMCLDVDVAALLPGVEKVLATLAGDGLERTQAVADQLFPRIALRRSSDAAAADQSS